LLSGDGFVNHIGSFCCSQTFFLF